MAKPGDVSDSQFESEVLKAEVPVLVDFWAPWCGPCRMVEPIVEELAEEYGDKVKFLRMNTDDNGNTATQYGIRAIPTLIVFKDGEPAGQVIGFRPKSDLKKVIDQALSAETRAWLAAIGRGSGWVPVGLSVFKTDAPR